MRTAYDVIRSLTRYMALALPDDWEVREAAEEGVVQRPFAQVKETTAQDIDVNQPTVMEVLQSFIVYAYPERDTESVLHSRAMAEDTRERLLLAFNRGIDEGRPRLVPIYDYEDVAWDQPSQTRRSVDFARVRDFGVSLNQNPDDETLWAVLAEVRLGWRRDALLPSSEKTAQDIRVGFTT